MHSTIQLSAINKGSELYIDDNDTDLDSLPIDFSKLAITMDGNGQA